MSATAQATPERIEWRKLDAFTRAYITCALWSSNDESTPAGGEPMDKTYSAADITQEALREMAADCAEFQYENSETLAQAGNDEQNGHDFWLTRNRHGAGFWDRGYSDEIGKRLTDAAHAHGECNLYITDEGEVSL